MNNDKLSVKLLTQRDLIEAGCFNVPETLSIVEEALRKKVEGKVIFPDKISVIFDEASQNRINCLPAAIVDEEVYGMKWVSVFPGNPHLYGLQNLSAVILLSELRHGFPKAFMEGSLCSNLRTASMSAVAARYLAREGAQSIGFIGAGESAKSHVLAMMAAIPTLRQCKVSSRTLASEHKFIETLSPLYPEVEFIACGACPEKAARDSDIIVTAISGQETILQADWIKPGALYCHTGGLEDAYDVPRKASKIVCDDWEVVKHRTQTISRMFAAGELADDDIYANLEEIATGQKPGRTSPDEFIYFNTVGLSYVDVMLANHMYKKAIAKGLGTDVEIQTHSMFDTPRQYITLR